MSGRRSMELAPFEPHSNEKAGHRTGQFPFYGRRLKFQDDGGLAGRRELASLRDLAARTAVRDGEQQSAQAVVSHGQE